MLKKNIFNKKFSKIVLSITKRIESFFNHLDFFIFNKKKYSNFWKKPLDKKIFFGSGLLIFVIFTYFLLPAFYNKDKVKNQLQNQLLQKYNLKVKLDKDIKYRIFPKPHFFIEDAKIQYDSKFISKSKSTKFYISIKNNLKINKTKFKDIVFFGTDFKIDKSNFNFFLNLSKIKPIDLNIKFINNKLFYLDQNGDTIFYSDLKNLNYSYYENLYNEINSKLNIFNLPVKLKLRHDINDRNIFTNINFNTLKLKIEKDLNYNENIFQGEIELNYINKNQTIKYRLENNKLIFNSVDKKFTGDINIKPFFLLAKLNFQNVKIRNIFANNSILINFLKSEIFYNKNLNGKIKITLDGINDLNHIDKINFDIQLDEDSILISNLDFSFKSKTKVNFNNVSIIVDENELKFIGNVVLNFEDMQEIYSHFQIIRNYRKNIKQIKSNFIFNLNDESFELNELMINGIDNKISDKYLNKFNAEKKDIFNKVIFRNTVKDFFKSISLD